MSNKKDSLGDRMKERYENISRSYLTRRIPVVIRIDGKAFHTFTKGMKKPFDSILMKTMQQTMQSLCISIQGCVFGYTQSDEITLVLTDYATITTDAWFGYNLQKMCSISASIATLAFNKAFYQNVDDYFNREDVLECMYGEDSEAKNELKKYAETLKKALAKGALFDSRAFSVPKDEVCNCLIWRQQDATRNSIEAVGQAYFSANQLHKKTTNMIQEMLWQSHGINWNDFPIDCKRGSCCYKQTVELDMPDPKNPGKTITVSRRKWLIDREPPIFTQDRDYVERWL